MQTLIDTVSRIRQTIRDHGQALSKNETMTRYALIDPLLGELGWDLSDPGDAVPEDNTGPGGKIDYSLGGGAMIVEAKKLDEPLDKHAGKLISYVKGWNPRYAVQTNGRKWRMYDVNTTTKSPGVEFDITDSDGVVLPRAVLLHRSVVMEGIESPGPSVKEPEGGPEEPISEAPTGNIPGMALTDLNYSKGDRPPKSLISRDGSRKDLGSWVDLLAGVTEWLVKSGHLTAQDCPVRLGSKNYLLHTEPTHPNGKPFSTHRQVDGLYVFTNFDPANVIRYAKKLIGDAGLEPSNFRVDLSDSASKDG